MSNENFLPNAAWVNRILGEHWSKIEHQVGVAAMPVEGEGSKGRKRVVEEYGCGFYGCVMPTTAPGIVTKLTTDPLEAHFIAAALKIGEFPDGIVRYLGIYRLDATYRRRPVFICWREEAFDVGMYEAEELARKIAAGHDRHSSEYYEMRAIWQFKERLSKFREWAHHFKTSTDRSTVREELLRKVSASEQWARERIEISDAEEGFVTAEMTAPQKLAAYLRAARLEAEMMANEPGGTHVGEAMLFYLDHGILLADVHSQNVGHVVRDGDPFWVITDPGHAVPLDQRYETVTVDVL